MANNHEDNNVTTPEPPPPGTLTTNSTTTTNREAYGGGPDERTPLINQQPTPIDNFQATGQNNPETSHDTPITITCPNCRRNVQSKVVYRFPHWSCPCCLFNSILCYIPLCTGGSKDIVHSCPHCNTDIEGQIHTRYNIC